MTTVGLTTAVGVFEKRVWAESAVDALHQAGFSDNQIGFVTRNNSDSHEEATGEEINRPSTTASAVSGGVVGGAIGVLTAMLIPGLGPVIAGGIWAVTVGGVALGALAGGLAGSLAKMGVPEEEARYCQEQLQSGRTIVTVEAATRYQDALTILREAGAVSYNVHNDLPGANGSSNMVGEPRTEAEPAISSAYESEEETPTALIESTEVSGTESSPEETCPMDDSTE